jgi:hypothetical protein
MLGRGELYCQMERRYGPSLVQSSLRMVGCDDNVRQKLEQPAELSFSLAFNVLHPFRWKRPYRDLQVPPLPILNCSLQVPLLPVPYHGLQVPPLPVSYCSLGPCPGPSPDDAEVQLPEREKPLHDL